MCYAWAVFRLQLLERKPKRKHQAQNEGNILILVLVFMPASRPFSRWNKNYCVCACACACPCLVNENHASVKRLLWRMTVNKANKALGSIKCSAGNANANRFFLLCCANLFYGQSWNMWFLSGVVTQPWEKRIQSFPVFENFPASKQHVLEHLFTSDEPSYNLDLKWRSRGMGTRGIKEDWRRTFTVWVLGSILTRYWGTTWF